jgi:SAM-dependent methyltransferase
MVQPGERILHFAPEPFIVPLFRARHVDYTAADLHPEAANNARGIDIVEADITDLPFPDGAFDRVFVSHVLEHVPDDQAAVRELHRVLDTRGVLVAQHPWDPERATTFADPSVSDPGERLRLFGQSDHVRVYGRDHHALFEANGFAVRTVGESTPGTQIDECFKTAWSGAGAGGATGGGRPIP